jgi:hypothetical protein
MKQLIQTLEIVDAHNIPLLYCSDINEAHSKIYNVYFNKVKSLIDQQIKDEDISGESNLIQGIVQYQMANLLVTMFYKDFTSGDYSLGDLLTFYKVDELRECFRCVGIDLKSLFDAVDIDIVGDFSCTEGIEHITIEKSFQIEVVYCAEESDSPTTGETVNLEELINQNHICEILIN